MGRRQNAIFQPALTRSGHHTFESFPWLQAPLPPLRAGRALMPVTPLETGHGDTVRMEGAGGWLSLMWDPQALQSLPLVREELVLGRTGGQ